MDSYSKQVPERATGNESSELYASLGRRLLAFLLDALILAVPMIIGSSIVPFLGGVLVWFFYSPVLESSEMRATIGKHLAGIQVADEMGRRISLKAALVRNLLKAISTVLLFVGFFFAAFSKRRQALHDMLADTFVVYGRSEVSLADAWLTNVKEIFGALGATGGAQQAPSAGTKVPPTDEAPLAQQLERLQALREKGALTEEEFQAAKRKILGS